MDNSIKLSIESRKNAFYNSYNITDEATNKKIEDLFSRINELGESCKDVGEFEMKFASSPLNNEYIGLFTDIAMSYIPKEYQGTPSEVQSATDQIVDEVESDVRYMADDLTAPARRAARQEAYDKMRDIPIVGDIMYAKQNIDFANSITGNYSDNNDQ